MSSAIARRRIDRGKHQAEIRCYAKAKERSRGLYTTAAVYCQKDEEEENDDERASCVGWRSE